MKRFLLLFGLCFTFVATHAQSGMNCTNFCILNVTLDSANHQLDVTIYNGDSQDVNYPVVQVVNASGDTVGNINGQFFLFAQLAGDTVVHSIPTSLTSWSGSFTGIVYFSNAGDSIACMYSYPMSCTVGVNELALNNRISVYPNPASDQVTIAIKRSTQKEAFIAIYDMTGNIVRSYTTADTQLTLNRDGLKSGMYFVSVVVDGKRYTNKLIIN